MENIEEVLEGLKQHIHDSSRQSWLFGAGISKDANVPLMYPLTDRVKSIINASDTQADKDIVTNLCAELYEDTHVEHYLSHLGDLIALAERSRTNESTLNNERYSYDQLIQCYKAIVAAIGDTVRYGYVDDDNIGSIDKPLVDVRMHDEFVKALLRSKANFEQRSKIKFFSTNYDTLLEDALALNKVKVIDGFSGAALGFWNGVEEFSRTELGLCCKLYKLHGSVDWIRDRTVGLIRARFGTKYVSDTSDTMIYPQATKYVETQKDPFALLFSEFRTTLQSDVQNVLLTCGYSFGDEHINTEIEACLSLPLNKTTVIAFTDEKPSDGITTNKTLDTWLSNERFSQRVFVAGKNGLYHGSLNPIKMKEDGELNWWRFDGLIKFLEQGEIL